MLHTNRAWGSDDAGVRGLVRHQRPSVQRRYGCVCVCVCVSARVYVCMLCHAHTHTCMHQSTKWANHPATDLLLPLCLLLRVRRCERHRLDGVHFQRTLIHVSSVGLQLRIATLLKGLRVFLRAMNTSSFNILSTTVLFFPYFFSNTNTPNTDQEAPLVVHHGLERAHIIALPQSHRWCPALSLCPPFLLPTHPMSGPHTMLELSTPLAFGGCTFLPFSLGPTGDCSCRH